jgi:hypothetical protein
LDLNRGIKETFFTPTTPLSFLDRFTKKDGMTNLVEVLSKWNKGESYYLVHSVLTSVYDFANNSHHGSPLAFYIPPKQSQAFNQGGTFIFNGEKTIFAHYDGTFLGTRHWLVHKLISKL